MDVPKYVPDHFRVLNLISGLTREVNLLFPSTHALFCLLYNHSHVLNNGKNGIP